MKTKVVVTLVGTLRVPLEVEHEEGEDPTSLTPEEEREAISGAFMSGDVDWDVDRVEKA